MSISLTESADKLHARWNGIVRHLGLVLVFVQVVLIALLMRELDMQSSAFRRVVYIATGGFVIHHLLPMRFRLRFFLLLSVSAIFLVLGGSYAHPLWNPALGIPRAAMVLAVGAALIGICHLPFRLWVRVVLLLVAGVYAAMYRVGIFGSAEWAIILPVLASIFMFRIMIYLYDLSSSRNRSPLTFSLCYFFLLPNVCCPLFPVIDFKKLSSFYYNEASLTIYQRGAHWMGRGVIQLLLYRFINQLFYVKASEVANGTDLIQFLITNSLLYLNISGLFHLIVGMLLLFGFNLPETNHRYFLASSFTDYWRRVNIYWKDFMMKVFYYPTFFKLKSQGTIQALIVATLVCFFATWVLHLYQTMWLKGSMSVSWPDMLFWVILGLLVLANSLWEMKHGRKRKLAGSRYRVYDATWLVLRTAGTFACICLLWSLWSSPSVSLWIGLWKYADGQTVILGLAVLAVVMVATIICEILPSMRCQPTAMTQEPALVEMIRSGFFQYAGPLLIIFVLAHPAVQSHLDHPRLQPFRDVLAAGDSMVNSGKVGYYEQLTNVDEGDRQLWETFLRQRIPRGYIGERPNIYVKDLRLGAWLPSVHVQAYETDFQTNRWGMRDREYEQTKSPGTLRMALLGSSQVVGWGVKHEEIFKTIVEEKLNRERLLSAPAARFEILNFAFNGSGPLNQIPILESQARLFNPDLVLFVAHYADTDRVRDSLCIAVQRRIPIPYEFLRQTLHNARVEERTPRFLANQRLAPYEQALVAWSYKKIVEECRSMGALPVYIFLPLPTELPFSPQQALEVTRLKTMAIEVGFIDIDISSVFDNQDPQELLTRNMSDQTTHCNRKAHALIANALYRQLMIDPRIDLVNRAQRASANAAGNSSITKTKQ
jgi:hypothetical protein